MTFLTNLTLGKKITLLTTLGLLIGFGVFSSLGLRAVNQATEAMLQDRMTTARMVAGYVDEALGHALSELQNTAQAIQINGTENNLEAPLQALEATYSRLSIYTHSMYLLNERGEIMWSQPKANVVGGFKIPSHPSISHTIKTGESTVSGLTSVPMTGVPVVFLASPVRGEQENNRVLVVAVDPTQSSIGSFVQPITLGETGYVEIVDQNGIVVTRTRPGPELAPFEKSDHSGRFAALISAGRPTRGVCHTCHEPEQRVEKRDVLAFVPLSEASWGVAIRQSEREALAPARELQQNLLLFGACLVAVAILFVIITTRDVGSRIRMLTSAAQRIAEGDLVSPVPALERDEVGRLGQALNNMRAKLKASYDELQRKTLEAGVLKLEKEPLLIPRLTEKVVEEIKPRAKKHKFILQFAPSFPVVEAAGVKIPGVWPAILAGLVGGAICIALGVGLEAYQRVVLKRSVYLASNHGTTGQLPRTGCETPALAFLLDKTDNAGHVSSLSLLPS